jgi:hypothetical protein
MEGTSVKTDVEFQIIPELAFARRLNLQMATSRSSTCGVRSLTIGTFTGMDPSNNENAATTSSTADYYYQFCTLVLPK